MLASIVAALNRSFRHWSLLPAVLLSVPVARLLAPLPAWLLGLVIGVLGAASVWFSLYLITAGWAP